MHIILTLYNLTNQKTRVKRIKGGQVSLYVYTHILSDKFCMKKKSNGIDLTRTLGYFFKFSRAVFRFHKLFSAPPPPPNKNTKQTKQQTNLVQPKSTVPDRSDFSQKGSELFRIE